MAQRERYLLSIWRSRGLAGWQWTARLDRLSDGERHRFTDPSALLEHVRDLVGEEPPPLASEEKGGT